MDISKNSITSFQALYKKRFGKEISQSEAKKQGAQLVQLFEVVCQQDNTHPINTSDNKLYEKKSTCKRN